jgi:hypothetical protein
VVNGALAFAEPGESASRKTGAMIQGGQFSPIQIR